MSSLRKVSSIITYYGKGVTPKYVRESSIIVLNQKCIRHNNIDYAFAQYVEDKKTYNEEKFLKVGDILINSTGQGTAGRVAMVNTLPFNKKVIIDSHILVIRTDNYLEAKCLNYSLFSIEKQLQTFMDGSTGQGEFDKQRLFNLIISYSEESSVQKKITDTLTSIDKKIKLNNRLNDNLEQMAKTIYDYWFVQFDFPDENGKPYKSSGGKMVYNDELKREIPDGWKVSVFSHWVAKTKTGDWGKDTVEGNYTEHVYCIRGADLNGLNGKGEVKPPERYILKNNLSKSLKAYDFIIEISGGSPTQSTGRIALLTETSFDRFRSNVICSNFCKAISLKDEKFVFNFRQEWQRLYDAGVLFGFEGKTSGIKNFLYDSFMGTYQIITPNKEVVIQYYKCAKAIERKKQSNLQQNQELAQLRDWLLPMLMNGQVTIK